MADFTSREISKEQAHQFVEAISPPLMLILSLLLAHAAEMVFAPPLSYPSNRNGQAIFGSQEGLLQFRGLCFSTHALVAAVWTTVRTKQPRG